MTLSLGNWPCPLVFFTVFFISTVDCNQCCGTLHENSADQMWTSTNLANTKRVRLSSSWWNKSNLQKQRGDAQNTMHVWSEWNGNDDSLKNSTMWLKTGKAGHGKLSGKPIPEFQSDSEATLWE
ncbi:uncharacterized protein LOC134190070 [Corticium candelabrum]|uniref:uncharacterized protein LOC134190070 n=1 Tax=Corticium candelabrum TaxID=121492 RepID=UPI002E269AC1|nr:uncharacterized protein LOC134190070 [Corticium candelabrum]